MRRESTKYSSLWALIFILLLLVLGCATATKQPSLFETNPTLLTKQYTPDEIAAIKQNFDANPLQYSQEFGNLLLWQMHQKSSEFAKEFAQTPELNDGINPAEANAISSIYNLIKDLDMSPSLFFVAKPKPGQDIYKIIIEWECNTDKPTEWRMFLSFDDIRIGKKFRGELIDIQPLNRERSGRS